MKTKILAFSLLTLSSVAQAADNTNEVSYPYKVFNYKTVEKVTETLYKAPNGVHIQVKSCGSNTLGDEGPTLVLGRKQSVLVLNKSTSCKVEALFKFNRK